MVHHRAAWMLVPTLAGCSTPRQPDGTETGLLLFADANVVPISGGYSDPVVPVAASGDVCIDTSGVGSPVGSIVIWQLNMGEGGARCALAQGSVTQASVLTSGLFAADPGEGPTCFSAMDTFLGDPVFTCAPGTSWVVGVADDDGVALAWRILDPCADGGSSEVVIDGSAPSFTEVMAEVDAAAPLVVQAGVRYTLDWSGVTQDAFGEAVNAAAWYRIVVADLAADIPLADAVLAPEDSAETWYELWKHDGETTRDLGEVYDGPEFPGFDAEGRYLVGFSPPSDCVQASVIATVEVTE